MSIFRRRSDDPKEPVKIAWASHQAEAELIEQILKAEGIPCLIRRNKGFDVPDFLAAGPRDILVPPTAAARARELLDGLKAEDADLPGG